MNIVYRQNPSNDEWFHKRQWHEEICSNNMEMGPIVNLGKWKVSKETAKAWVCLWALWRIMWASFFLYVFPSG